MNEADHKSHTLTVRKALLDLQKELLNHLKEQFEKENSREVPPAEWLQVLMMSQRYAWMRELTTLIADIDMLTELEFLTPEQAATARHEIERMLFATEDKGEFQKHYRNLLKSGSHVMLHHGHLRKSLSALPHKPMKDDEATEQRKAWHEEHRQQARKKRN